MDIKINSVLKLKIIKILSIFYFIFFSTSFGFYYFLTHKILNTPEIIVEEKIQHIYLPDSTKTHDQFLNDIGFIESGGDYNKVNRLGYLGKYQFSLKTLKMLDINVTAKEFLENDLLQDYAMNKYLLYNKKILKKYIGEYQFTTLNGIYITESGILAASHLGGAGNIKKFFDSNGEKDFTDGNNTPITNYLNKFSGYHLEFK